MNKPVYGDSDPIAALATPLAESALALIRTSGEGTFELLAKVFSRPQKLKSAPAVVHGWIVEPDEGAGEQVLIDEVLVTVFQSPKSYTGEDSAEISCHGGIAAINAVLAALKKAGFREALPGEFTFRAFMNGKLDLTRAESVMELVAAKTGRSREQAIKRLSGALEKEISSLKALLVDVLAGTEIYLDYSEDEFSTSTDEEIIGRLPERKFAEKAVSKLKTLSDHWQRERIFIEGALAVLAGRPNAGKSSLFNYLLREDRSIVTETPGTTRDWIEAQIAVEDIPLRLADTAGLRELLPEKSCEADSKSCEAEQIGMKRSLELLDKADIILYLIDGAEGITAEDKEFLLKNKASIEPKPIIVIWNKLDIFMPPALLAEELKGDFLALSAKTGEGIIKLMRAVADKLKTSSSPVKQGEASAGPGTLRQKELIDSALLSLEEALNLDDLGEPLDIIAQLIRSAIDALGEITGEVSNADILHIMFSRFCVGK